MSTVPERLQALRGLMKERNIDAYIVCTDDFHGSEYVGDYFKARKFMSGFTGSAGTLVVTMDEAGLWTDGRYFLQAAAQLENSTIVLQKMGEDKVPTIPEYIAAKFDKAIVVGFDGRTVKGSFVNEILEKKKDVSFDGSEDLVDSVWTDRPSLSKKLVWELGVEYTGMSRADKFGIVRESMKKENADILVLTALDDIAWLLNLRGDDVPYNPVFLSYIIIDDKKSVLYIDEDKLDATVTAALKADAVSIKPYNDIYEDLKKISPEAKVLVDKASVNYNIMQNLPDMSKVNAAQSPVTAPKAAKTATEQENEKKAHIKDGIAVTKFIHWLKENVAKTEITEISAAEKLEEFRKQQEGYLGQSFDPIMGYAAHGAIVHYSATKESDAVLKPESFLLSDTGGQYYEGTTDITRTIALGKLTDEEKKIFTLVLKGHLNLAAVKFKYGTRGENLDYIAREPLWREGLDYNHGTGHGVGYLLNVHERPNGIRWRIPNTAPGTAVFEEGMITSDEPGMYLTGKFGIRHESLVLCKKLEANEYGQFMGFETLTMVPFDLEAVNTDLMTDLEIELLNDYHKKVFDAISPAFEGEELEWLKSATRAVSR